MRLLIEGEPAELSVKGGALAKALSARLGEVGIDLLDELTKALPAKVPVLKYRALRELNTRTTAMYANAMADMLSEVGKVLDTTVTKSEVLAEHVNSVVDREDIAYRRVKSVLIKLGRKQDEFDAGGVLFGYSINELIELVKRTRE